MGRGKMKTYSAHISHYNEANNNNNNKKNGKRALKLRWIIMHIVTMKKETGVIVIEHNLIRDSLPMPVPVLTFILCSESIDWWFNDAGQRNRERAEKNRAAPLYRLRSHVSVCVCVCGIRLGRPDSAALARVAQTKQMAISVLWLPVLKPRAPVHNFKQVPSLCLFIDDNFMILLR